MYGRSHRSRAYCYVVRILDQSTHCSMTIDDFFFEIGIMYYNLDLSAACANSQHSIPPQNRNHCSNTNKPLSARL